MKKAGFFQRKTRLALLGLATVLFFGAVSVRASEPGPLPYELYSWRHGRQWRFSVFEGTTTARSVETIQESRSVLRGETYLKGRLATLQPEDTLYWRERPARGLRLPPDEMVRDIQEYLDGLGVHLLLPRDLTPPAPKTPEVESHPQK